MRRDLALTFKQLLCPLLVVNSGAKKPWNIDVFHWEKSLLNWICDCKTPSHALCQPLPLCSDTHLQECHLEVSGKAGDNVSAHQLNIRLLGAQGILQLLIPQDVWTFKSFKGASSLNNSCPHATQILSDFGRDHAALAERGAARPTRDQMWQRPT